MLLSGKVLNKNANILTSLLSGITFFCQMLLLRWKFKVFKIWAEFSHRWTLPALFLPFPLQIPAHQPQTKLSLSSVVNLWVSITSFCYLVTVWVSRSQGTVLWFSTKPHMEHRLSTQLLAARCCAGWARSASDCKPHCYEPYTFELLNLISLKFHHKSEVLVKTTELNRCFWLITEPDTPNRKTPSVATICVNMKFMGSAYMGCFAVNTWMWLMLYLAALLPEGL